MEGEREALVCVCLLCLLQQRLWGRLLAQLLSASYTLAACLLAGRRMGERANERAIITTAAPVEILVGVQQAGERESEREEGEVEKLRLKPARRRGVGGKES